MAERRYVDKLTARVDEYVRRQKAARRRRSFTITSGLLVDPVAIGREVRRVLDEDRGD